MSQKNLKIMMSRKVIPFTLILLIATTACHSNYTPKPRGYFRIDMPKRSYQSFDTTFPYSFQYPTYAKITNDPFSPEKKYWIDIRFPRFHATIHISYKVVNGNLIKYFQILPTGMQHFDYTRLIDSIK